MTGVQTCALPICTPRNEIINPIIRFGVGRSLFTINGAINTVKNGMHALKMLARADEILVSAVQINV